VNEIAEKPKVKVCGNYFLLFSKFYYNYTMTIIEIIEKLDREMV